MTTNALPYIRDYLRVWKARRRTRAIRLLGGKCARCAATDALEFDHLDRNNKIDDVGKMMCARNEVFWAEVAKCQLLCHACHAAKTAQENAKCLTEFL